jgi:hypothetical protein
MAVETSHDQSEGNIKAATNHVHRESGFNWVKERSQCTLPQVFATLRRQIEEDVKTRNSVRPALAPYEFSVVENGDEFKVVLTAGESLWKVTFGLLEHAILVYDNDGDQLFEVTIKFNEEGECRFKAKDEHWELWQIRRMALEELMFRAN